MSPEVRVHVRLGSIRLAFEGDQSFYEKHVETLVESAARRGVVEPRAHPAPGHAPLVDAIPAGASPPPAPGRDGAGPAPDPAAPAAGSAKPRGFVPVSGEFGRYIRRLGPEAVDPDRQIVALAFYLWNYERRATFGVGELEGCFRALGLPLPDGVAGLLADLTERKRFLEAAGDGVFRLSRKGENYVKTRLLAS